MNLILMNLSQHPTVPLLHHLRPGVCTSCAAQIETVVEAQQRCFQTVRHTSMGGGVGEIQGACDERWAPKEKDGKSCMLVFGQQKAGVVVCSLNKKGSGWYF